MLIWKAQSVDPFWSMTEEPGSSLVSRSLEPLRRERWASDLHVSSAEGWPPEACRCFSHSALVWSLKWWNFKDVDPVTLIVCDIGPEQTYTFWRTQREFELSVPAAFLSLLFVTLLVFNDRLQFGFWIDAAAMFPFGFIIKMLMKLNEPVWIQV